MEKINRWFWCCIFIPENLWPNKHQDVMNNLIQRADKKVWSKGSAESAEERRLASFLKGFSKQNLWLFYWLSILLFSPCCSFWGVECLIYGPNTKAQPNQRISHFCSKLSTWEKKSGLSLLTFWPCCILGPSGAPAVAPLFETYPPCWATTNPSLPEAFYNLSPSIYEETKGTYIKKKHPVSIQAYT